jgi:hypothetical protein
VEAGQSRLQEPVPHPLTVPSVLVFRSHVSFS